MEHIFCLDACRDGKNLWLSNYDYNAFVKWDMDSGRAEIIDLFPQAPEKCGRLHRRVFHVGEKLYFIPLRGKYIHVRDLKQETWEWIRIAEEDLLVADAYLVENCFWIFPCYLRSPIRIVSIDHQQIEELTHLTEEIGDHVGKYRNWMFLDIACVCQRGNLFYLAEYRRSKVFCIDSVQRSLRQVYLNEEAVQKPEGSELRGWIKLQGISTCGEEDFWLTSMEETDVYLWNPEKGIRKVYEIETKRYGKRVPFLRVIDVNAAYALALPCHSDQLFKIGKETDTVERIPYPKGFARCKLYSLFCGYDTEGDEVFLYPRSGSGLLKIDVKSGKASYSAPVLNETDGKYIAGLYHQFLMEHLCTGRLTESYGGKDMLSDFLDEVARQEENRECQPVEAVGKKIYQYCKAACLQEK